MRHLIRTKHTIPAILAVGALTVAALVIAPLLTLHHHGSASPTPSPSPTTSPTPSPSGAVTLVKGSHAVDGIEVGYPHTTVGAISAAVQYLDAAESTLDPDYAASVIRLVGDPANASLSANFATSTVDLRADLKLPTTGPLPAPIAFQTTAAMFQARDDAADSLLVLVLASGTYTNGQGGIAQTTGVFPLRMHWVDGDWRLAAVGGDGHDYSPLNVNPYTSEAAARGWLPLVSSFGGDAP